MFVRIIRTYQWVGFFRVRVKKFGFGEKVTMFRKIIRSKGKEGTWICYLGEILFLFRARVLLAFSSLSRTRTYICARYLFRVPNGKLELGVTAFLEVGKTLE